MIGKAIAVWIVTWLASFFNFWFGYIFTSQPIIVSALVGAVLGDVSTGCKAGSAYELIYMGALGIGASIPSDPTNGSAISTSFVILSGISIEESCVIAVPAGLLCAQMQVLFLTIRGALIEPLVEAAINKGQWKKAEWIIRLNAFLYCGIITLPTLLAVALGTDFISGLLAAIPAKISEGIALGANTLSAVGFAMLLNIMWTTSLAVYFFIGWFLAAYLGVPVTGIAIAAVLYCVARYFASAANNEEDLFDD